MYLQPWIPFGKPNWLWKEAYRVSGQWLIIYFWKEGAYWECHPLASHPQLFLSIWPTLWIPDGEVILVDCQYSCSILIKLCYCLIIMPPQSIWAILTTFHGYAERLDDWGKPYEIRDMLNHQPRNGSCLVMVSNRGAKSQETMSFGFLLGTSIGVHLLENSSPAYGDRSSFWAEAIRSPVAVAFHQVYWNELSNNCTYQVHLQQLWSN